MEPTPQTRITTQAELAALWRELVSPLTFDEHILWMLLIGADDRVLSPITQITGAVDPPDRVAVESFALLLRKVADQLGPVGRSALRVALLRSRPGPGPADDEDRAWAGRLLVACRMAGVPAEVVHLACDDTLVPLPWDELTTADLPWTA